MADVPSFGGPYDPVPGQPAAPPLVVPPNGPVYGTGLPPPQQPMMPAPSAPAFRGGAMRTILPMVASALAARGNPVAIGTSLAAFTQGQRLRRAEMEDQFAREARERREAAEFYGRAVQQAQSFDDPIAFKQWRDAIAPMAGVHGIDVETITYNGTLASQKQATDIIAKLRQVHGNVVDDPAWQGQHTAQFQGNTAKVSDIYAAAKLPTASTLSGAPVTPPRTDKRGFTPKNIKTPTRPAGLVNYDPDAGKYYDIDSGEVITGPIEEVGDAQSSGDLSRSSLDVQLLDAKRRAASGEPGAAEQVKLIEETILKGDTLRRDPPRVTVNVPSPTAQFGMSERLAAAWTKAMAPVREMERQLRLMDTGLKRFRSGDKNGGSQAVLVTFQKILDPTSVVRESEYARTTQGQSLINRIEGYATRLAQGGTTLTDREMAAMVETAQQMLWQMHGATKGTRTRISSQAQKYQLDEATIFDDVLTGAPDAPDQDAQTPPLTDYGRYLQSRGQK